MPRGSTPPDGLQLRLLGELQVVANGRPLPLPQSKKTRALLGYLALTPRAHRRERLCSFLWDVADDPRAALRWSLSKLREVVDSGDEVRLIADREHVSLDLQSVYVDALEVGRLLGTAPEQAPVANLEAARALFHGELLEGLELPDFPAYDAWCLAERTTYRELHRRVLHALLARSGGHPDKALPLARELAQLDPSDEAARAHVLELLHATGRIREAEEQSRANRRLVAEPLPPSAAKVGSRAAEPTATPVLHADELPFVGRDAERARVQLWLEAPRRELRLLLIDGDAGIGKSRLLRELIRTAADAGTRTALTRAPDTQPGWPYAAFRELLQTLLPADAEPPLRAALAPLLQLGTELPSAEANRDSLFRAVAECIERAAPLLIAIDDAHLLDDASAELLQFLALSLRAVRVELVLAGREGELRDRAGIARALRTLRRDGRVEELTLGPLTPGETHALVAGVRAGAEAHAALLVEQSAGNPLFAIELAREPTPADGTVPQSISRVLRDRVEALSPEQSDLLRWAAVLGDQFAPELLAQLVELPPELLVDTLERLERYGWLQLRSDRSGFSHALVHRAVYHQLSEPRRRLMHTRIARALAARSDDTGTLAVAIAHHAMLGGDRATAARACLSAGQRCLRMYAHADAFSLARRGLAYAAALADPERTTLAIELHDVSIRARRPLPPDDAMRELTELCARALDLGALEHARIGFYMRAYLMWEHGELADARHFAREVERISRLADPQERVHALSDAARCLALLERDMPEAEAYLLEAESVVPDPETRPVLLLLARGIMSVYRGELERAEADLDRAWQRTMREANRLEGFFALESRVLVDFIRHDYSGALARASELATLAERLRDGSEVPFAAACRALARYGVGLDPTPEALDRALEALALADAKQRRATLLLHAAELEERAAAWPLAVAHAEEALRLAEIMERHSESALAHSVLGAAEVATGGQLSVARVQTLARLVEGPLSAHARARAQTVLGTSKEKRHGARHRRTHVR